MPTTAPVITTPRERNPRRFWSLATAAFGLLGAATILACTAAWQDRLPARIANQFHYDGAMTVTGTTSLTSLLAVLLPFALVIPLALALLLGMSRLRLPAGAAPVTFAVAAVWSAFATGVTLFVFLINLDVTDPGARDLGAVMRSTALVTSGAVLTVALVIIACVLGVLRTHRAATDAP